MKDLREWIAACESEGELKRVKPEVDWELEIGHIATLNERAGGPALLFEKVKGYDIPVLASTLSTAKRLAITCGRPTSYTICDLAREWKDVIRQNKLVPPVEIRGEIPVMYDVIEGDKVNVYDIPSPRLYPQDGGRYLALACNFITRDPETGWVNLGTYRGMVMDEKAVGANMMGKAKHGRIHIDKTLKTGTKMSAALYCGCDMSHLVVGSTMVPAQQDEYSVIGAMIGEPVEVFTSDLTGLPLPAHAEFILEGEIDLDPASFRPEGPLGEYVGYYGASGEGTRPWLNVKRIYRRKDPIFVISTVGRPVGDAHMINSIGRTAYLWADLETMKVPGIQSVYCPPEAAGRFWAIVSAKITHPAGAERVAEAVSCSPTGHFGMKGIIVVDADVPADDMAGVWWSLACRYDPGNDTQIINKMRPTPFDPALPAGAKAVGSKILIDATTPVEWEKKPRLVELDETTTKTVLERWLDYGFDEPYRLSGQALPK
ncbi:MAG: UbiD family decarboxylase [Actinobacteria bacterium]|nr:UbiD family decarboxylase [Actinomycetota bacterium]